MTSAIPVQATKVSLDIVEILVDRGRAGASEIAGELDRPTSTVHDHLRTLEQLGLLINSGGEYRLSTRFLEIGNRVQRGMEIYQKSHDELVDLADETGEFASLMVEEDGLGVILCMKRGRRAAHVTIRRIHPGTRTRLHTTAPGKAILASLSPDRTREIFQQYDLTAKTDNTITSPKRLFEELETVDERGYAVDDEERFEGMRGVGAAVISDEEETKGAISVYGPVNHLDDETLHDDLADRVTEVANVVQVSLDYS